MSNRYLLSDLEDSPSHACEWLARLERGLSAAETSALREWLAASPKNATALMEVARLWDKMDSLSRLAALFPKPVSHRMIGPRIALALIAAVLIFSAATLVVFFGWRGQHQAESATVAQSSHQFFETAVGEQSTIRLPDGSELTLNTNSRVFADFDESGRRLRLERGEVYVKVARDPVRPLTLWAGDRLVRAVGTEFNVEIKEDQRIEVIVTQGKVLIGVIKGSPPAEAGALLEKTSKPVSAGQHVVLGREDAPAEPISSDDIDVKLSWRHGNLVFHGEPLAEALDQIERYTRVEFVIQDEELKTIRVAGFFKAGDVDGLLETLRQNFNITYERVSADRIVLKSR